MVWRTKLTMLLTLPPVSLLGPDWYAVIWITRAAAASVVRYQVQDRDNTTMPAQLTLTSTGTSRTYTAGNWHGIIHEVTPPTRPTPQCRSQVNISASRGKRLFYQVGDGQSTWSAMTSFTTEPTSETPVTVGMFGDMGTVRERQGALIPTLEPRPFHSDLKCANKCCKTIATPHSMC